MCLWEEVDLVRVVVDGPQCFLKPNQVVLGPLFWKGQPDFFMFVIANLTMEWDHVVFQGQACLQQYFYNKTSALQTVVLLQ